jgi:hypothetical protein
VLQSYGSYSLSRYAFTIPRSLQSVQVESVVFACWSNENINLWYWVATLCGLEVVIVSNFEESRHNTYKGNVFCLDKSHEGVTFRVVD